MRRDFAETVGLEALGWLVAQEDLLPLFLGSTGAGPDDLRRRAGEAAFLGAVLDFLLQDDAWLLRFCAAAGLAPDTPMQARRALPGGEEVHWS